MMELREQNPDLAAQLLGEYGRAPNPRFLFGDVSYDDFGSLDIEDYDIPYYTDQTRPPELDAALVNFYKKQGAAQLIQNVVTVETEKETHGGGKPFILIDNGNLYMATSSTSHGEIIHFLADELGMSVEDGYGGF